ncbi:MAG: serine--tRNA ligase [Patescibacteria group bacterium]
MLDINLIRKNPALVREKIKSRKFEPKLIDQFLELDKKVNEFKTRIEELRRERNTQTHDKPGPEELVILKHKKGTIKTLEMGLTEYANDRDKILMSLPNLPLDDVKIGRDENDNEIIRTIGKKTRFSFKPKDYLVLTEKLDLVDLDQASLVSGTRFNYLKGKLVDLQFAVFNYAVNFLRKENFTALVPPLMIKDETMRGLGYIEGLDEKEKYHFENDGLYLVGTAEQSLIPYHMNQTLPAEKLPLRYYAMTPAFRREAGSYGKDTKGILRSHQFDKLEMVSFCRPERGDEEQEHLLSIAEKLVKDLGIPYRIVRMCTGDLVLPSARTYDIESWLPGQNQYRETHSCSTCTDYQARRLKIRFKDESNQTQFVHTLNSTVFAMGRILIALMENFQTKEGTIAIPKVLQKYCGFKEIK